MILASSSVSRVPESINAFVGLLFCNSKFLLIILKDR